MALIALGIIAFGTLILALVLLRAHCKEFNAREQAISARRKRERDLHRMRADASREAQARNAASKVVSDVDDAV